LALRCLRKFPAIASMNYVLRDVGWLYCDASIQPRCPETWRSTWRLTRLRCGHTNQGKYLHVGKYLYCTTDLDRQSQGDYVSFQPERSLTIFTPCRPSNVFCLKEMVSGYSIHLPAPSAHWTNQRLEMIIATDLAR